MLSIGFIDILYLPYTGSNPRKSSLRDVWEQFKADHPNLLQYGEDFNGKGLGWGIRP